ncbi:MAG: class I SAM-dependent methyltransferase [Candidatus Thorarchaeota archaeon]|jgi:predicted O-methyltransferase YrrM
MKYTEVAPLLKRIGVTTPTEEMELRWLYRHVDYCVSRFGDPRILELGTFNGASAITAGCAIHFARSRNANYKGHFTTVDNYAAHDRAAAPGILSYEEVSQKIKLAQVDDVVSPVKDDDIEYLKMVEPYSLHAIWIDSLHTYRHVNETLEIVPEKMVDGALIAGHDYAWQGEGVVRAVERFRRKNAKIVCGFAVHWKYWWMFVNRSGDHYE